MKFQTTILSTNILKDTVKNFIAKNITSAKV